MKNLLLLVLCFGVSSAFAATAAEPLPSVAQHEFLGTVGMVALVLAVLGFIGLLTATAQKVDLHYGMGDVYLSVPMALAAWGGLVSLALMGARGDDLLPYMQEKLWLAGASFVIAWVLSFIMVKRCNPQAGFFALTFAAMGRVFVDTLSQLFSLLVVLCGVWVLFGGRKQDGEKVSFLGRLGCAFAFVWLFNLVWGSIRSTTKEPVSSANGYLLGILNVLCMAAAVYGGYVYMNRVPQQPASALVEAVRAQDKEKALQLMADNPLLDLNPAIETAVRTDNRRMLNLIVRSSTDLEHAIQYADSNDKEATLRFLREKAYLSTTPLTPAEQ